MSRPKQAAVAVVFLLSLSLALAAGAAETDPRLFVPAQQGFSQQAEKVIPYATDRLLVQFTEDAMEKSRLDIPSFKGARTEDAKTGLTSVDVLASRAGLRAVERPYQEFSDHKRAAQAGADRWFLLRFDTSRDMAELAKDLALDPNVAAVSLDWLAFPATTPGDPLHPDHWGHNNTAQLPGLDWGGTYSHTLPTTVGTVGFDANAEAAWDGSQGYGTAGVVIAILDSGVDIDHPDLRLVTG